MIVSVNHITLERQWLDDHSVYVTGVLDVAWPATVCRPCPESCWRQLRLPLLHHAHLAPGDLQLPAASAGKCLLAVGNSAHCWECGSLLKMTAQLCSCANWQQQQFADCWWEHRKHCTLVRRGGQCDEGVLRGQVSLKTLKDLPFTIQVSRSNTQDGSHCGEVCWFRLLGQDSLYLKQSQI